MVQKVPPMQKTNPGEGEQAFRWLFVDHPFPMFVYDLKTLAFLEVNEAALEKYGYSREEFRALTIKDILPPEDVTRLPADRKQKRTPLQHSGQWRHRLKDGYIIDVEITSHIIEFKGRKAALVMAHDITERVQAEAALLESEEHYRFFQGILRSSSDGILVVNRENKVLYANERFVEMWMIPKEMMIAKDDTLLLQYVLNQLSDPQSFLQKVQELYDSAEESLDTLHFKDGRVFDRLSRPMLQGMELRGRVWSFRDITERRRAEEALRRSEERYRSLFDRMMDGVYRSTHEGKFVDVNPAMVKMFGYSSKEEMLEVDIKNELYFAPEERGSHILDTGREEMDVFRMRRKDGSEIWVEDHGFYVHDKQGRIIFHEGMLRDITERKQAEERIRESEERYRDLVENSQDLICTHDLEGRILSVNLTATRVLGYKADEIINKNLLDFLAPGSEDGFKAYLAVIEKEGIASGLLRVMTRAGEVRVWEYNNNLRQPEGEEPVVRGMSRDVTERWRAEKALRKSHNRMLLVLDSIPADIYIADINTYEILFMNQHMRNSFGDNLVGQLCWQVFRGAPGPCPHCTNDQLVDSQGNPTGVMIWEGQNPISKRWYSNYDRAIHWIGGNLARVQIAVDITERRWAEEALAASEAELRALFASMHDVALVIDREGVYRKIAPTNPGLLVKPPEELLGKNLKDIFPAEKAEAFCGIVQQVLDTKQNTQIEYELIIGGRIVWFQATISPLNADNTLWVAHDITKRKQAEEALRTAEANYRSIFENATMGIYQSTPQGRFLSVNPVMARIFGYDSPEEMLNSISSIEKQYYVDTVDRREFQRLLMEQGEVREFVSLNRRKDGRHIWVQENARAAKDANGSILHYEGFITDITERKQAEEELRRAKDALETANLELQQSLEREKLLACTDGLTGLYNHRYIFELAAREFQAAVRHRRPLTFLMFDMDDFKQVNDTLGHTAGDKLLMTVARTAVAQVRASDVVARYGGDEFIVMLPQASAQHALPIAERIRASVAAIRVDAFRDDEEPFVITLSIGIAEMWHEPVDENVERVIQRADEAMYKAKQSGRNRIVVFGQDETGAI